MQYNPRGTYDSTQSYAVSDVVSYTISGVTRYYYCLRPNDSTSPQSPSSADTAFWGILNTLSNFPNSVDSFLYRTNIQAQDKADIDRINQLTLQSTLTSSEQTELNNLIIKHRNKLFLADDLNAIQDSLSNMQLFFKDKIESYINSSVAQITSTENSALSALDAKKASIVSYMDSITEGAIRRDMGTLTDLTTNDKTSLVNAINELDSSISSVNDIAIKAKEIVLEGSSSFNSNTGVVINHNIGNTNYYVIITPTQNPNGYLGEVWVEKSNYSFKVLCSGSATTTFDYVVFVSN
jgi:hypothetical protein